MGENRYLGHIVSQQPKTFDLIIDSVYLPEKKPEKISKTRKMLNDHLFGYILTISSGILWGLSTPFMKQSFDWNDSISSRNILSSFWPIIKLLISNWKVIVIFIR